MKIAEIIPGASSETVPEAAVDGREPEETIWQPPASSNIGCLRVAVRRVVQAVIGKETSASRAADAYFEQGFTLPGRG